MKYQTKPKAL